MFETVLGRLQALAQAEGFDPQPGTVINGELRAYAAGIALVYDQLTDAREGAFAATAAEENLWRWLTARGLLPGDTLAASCVQRWIKMRPAKSCWRGGKCPGAIFL